MFSAKSLRYFSRLKQRCSMSLMFLLHQRNILSRRIFLFSRHRFHFVALQSTAALYAFSFGLKKADDVVKEPTKEELVIVEADRLYTKKQYFELYDYLKQHQDLKCDEILWRLARAAVDKGKRCDDYEEKKELYYEAFGYVKQALDLNDNNFASHKWYAILLDYIAEFEGTKQRIISAFKVKEHFMRAIELNPNDATSIHALGYWCFLFADMPWYQRQIASAVFASPPTSTYEEALMYFEKAEEIDPNFYCMNLLLLGKTYIRLKNYKMALKYLTKARDYPVSTPDDEKAHKEALELLKSIGVKYEEK